MSDFESLKSTNQVIQRELTKWTQKFATLEKEKAQAEQKLHAEIENLKKNELANLVCLCEQLIPGNNRPRLTD